MFPNQACRRLLACVWLIIHSLGYVGYHAIPGSLPIPVVHFDGNGSYEFLDGQRTSPWPKIADASSRGASSEHATHTSRPRAPRVLMQTPLISDSWRNVQTPSPPISPQTAQRTEGSLFRPVHKKVTRTSSAKLTDRSIWQHGVAATGFSAKVPKGRTPLARLQIPCRTVRCAPFLVLRFGQKNRVGRHCVPSATSRAN
ncbi:hypothetical protein EDB85DRAFT_806529 [Lactarius pseudohatsudake]|nr:hypothetical protein EDB85DRAFT_806529 [Lactarius pseudohatsudake]